MISENSLDIDLDEEYVLGLLDYCTRPVLMPYEIDGGYGIKSKLSISMRKSKILVGVISKFFDSKGIDYQFKRRDSEGVPNEISIENNDSIKLFYNIGSGTFIQIAERMEYINSYILNYEGKMIAGREKLFCQIYKPWDKMHPWKNKKYTISFFKEKFGIKSVEDTFDVPDSEYPESITTSYVAGAFDAKGMITLLISEQPANATGHGMSVSARITISHSDIRVKPHFIRYFQKHNLEPSISDSEECLNIRFDSIKDVEKFVEIVGKNAIYLFELCELFHVQLIPAFKDQYHTTKDGFLDMLRAYEEVAPERPRAKYTTEYFEEKWDD